MRNKILISVILSLCGSLHAQVLTLDSVLNTIIRRNPALKMYDSRIRSSSEYAAGAGALDPPQVGAGFFMTPYNPMMWPADDVSGSQGMGSFMLSAEQMFMNRRKRNANGEVMRGMANVDRQMQSAMRNEMFAMAKMSYYMLVILQKKLAVLSESEKLLDYLVKSAELRYTHGMDKLSGYYKSEAMLAEMRGMKLMAEFEAVQQRITLNTLMNVDKDAVFAIDTSLAISDGPMQEVDSAYIATKTSGYRAITENINLLRARQNLERARLKPDFGIKYDHMVGFGRQPQQFSLMGMMTIPIAPWSSKMSRSAVNGLSYEIEALGFEQQAAVIRIAGTLGSYREQMRTKDQQLQLYVRQIIPSIRKNYEVSLLAFEQNKEELFMVLDAWQNLKLIQLNYLDMLFSRMELKVKYEKELEIR
jgi:outer membrane protein TolC